MQHLLYLTHRIPYPPNKGDKLRSFHLLEHLRKSHRVHLGTFIDDPVDWQYVDVVRQSCEDTFFAGLHPVLTRLKSLRGLLSLQALTIPYYCNSVAILRIQNKLHRLLIKYFLGYFPKGVLFLFDQ